MCQIVNRLDNNLDQAIRLTQNSVDVIDILKMTQIINGKAVAEALEFNYYDNETQAYKELAKATSYTASALRQAYQAYKAELIIRVAIKAKHDQEQEQIEADRQKQIKLAKTKQDKIEANIIAKNKKETVTKFSNETEDKLKGLSDGAKRELGKGTTTTKGATDTKAVTQAVEILEALPPKATAKTVTQYRSAYLDDQLNDWDDNRPLATDEKQAEKLYKQMEVEVEKLSELANKYNKLMNTKGISFIANALNIEIS